MRFIELHLEYGGVDVMLNVSAIAYVLPGDECTVIYFVGGHKDALDHVEVREKYEVVRELILTH